LPNRVGGSGCEQPECASRTTVRTVPVYGGSLTISQLIDYVLSRERLEADSETSVIICVHPHSIRNGLMFSPSLEIPILKVLWLRLTSRQTASRAPRVRRLSLSLSRLHLHSKVYWLRASQRCGCSPTKLGLLCPVFLRDSSVQTLVVLLPSDSRSPGTPLQLTNGLRQLAHKGLAPFG